MRKLIVNAIYIMITGMVIAVGYLMFTGGHGATAPLKTAPINLSDKESLVRGYSAFRQYCLSCHGLSQVRFSQLTKIGLSEDTLKETMRSQTEKPGDLMSVAMSSADAKRWFGAAPPDLSLMTSAKGVDYVYSYLTGFYEDKNRPTGWNNIYFNNVGMPHVLWQEQGVQQLQVEEEHKEGAEQAAKPAEHHGGPTLTLAKQGKLSPEKYEELAGDITNFLHWASEPDRQSRHRLGFIIMAFLGLFAVVTYLLNKNFWKDIK